MNQVVEDEGDHGEGAQTLNICSEGGFLHSGQTIPTVTYS